MKHKIEFVCVVNDKKETIVIVLKIDEHKFIMDAQDVYELGSIVETVFSDMIDTSEINLSEREEDFILEDAFLP